MNNIVFIGLPGCGKTTVSRLCAKHLCLPWQDTDADIEARCGLAIPSIFELYGVEYFRRIETECIRDLLLQNDKKIVSVGGGTVLLNEKLISENALVVYIKRDIDAIMTTLAAGSRPLVTTADSLQKLYDARHEIYERMANVTIENNRGVQATVEAAIQKITEAQQP